MKNTNDKYTTGTDEMGNSYTMANSLARDSEAHDMAEEREDEMDEQESPEEESKETAGEMIDDFLKSLSKEEFDVLCKKCDERRRTANATSDTYGKPTGETFDM